MAHTSEHHGYIMFVSRCNNFVIPHGAAGLYDGGYTRFRRRINAIPEWKEGV